MTQDHIDRDDDAVMKTIKSRSSDRVVKVTSTLLDISINIENAISNIQLFITKPPVYIGQILSALTYLISFKNLLLFVKVWHNIWTRKITQTSPPPYQRYSDFCVHFLIQLFILAISANTAFSLS